MMAKAVDRIIENPDKVKKADIVVGIPSYQEADSIGYVASIIDQGLTKYQNDEKHIQYDSNPQIRRAT